MSDQEDPVSRRQFFRGLGGDLLRALGEVSGLDRLDDGPSEPRVITNIQDFVSPERQASALNDIFGFLEHLDLSRDEEDQEPEAPADGSPEPEPA